LRFAAKKAFVLDRNGSSMTAKGTAKLGSVMAIQQMALKLTEQTAAGIDSMTVRG
jgi:hypothetical protein